MTSEGLNGFAGAHIPELCGLIAGTRDECVLVWTERDAHDISGVIKELLYLRASFHIPQDASVISRSGDDPLVVNEAAARKVTSVSVKFTGNTDGNFLGTKVVDGANVIQTTTSNETA